jgi:hypothetical protein
LTWPHTFETGSIEERRGAIYDNLRDLRFEYRAGNIPGRLRSDENAMETETMVLAEIDQVTEAGVGGSGSACGC